MRAMVFCDKDNFDRALNSLNWTRPEDDKRFFKIIEYKDFFLKKTQQLLNLGSTNIICLGTFIYTGRYTDENIRIQTKNIHLEIKKLDTIIKSEEELLNQIKSSNVEESLKHKVEEHVKKALTFFKERKEANINVIKKAKEKFEGQKKFVTNFSLMPLVKLKTTTLKNRGEILIQKGVDAKISVDMISLAYANAYDIAILLSGDADLLEAINLVRTLGKIVVIVSHYDNENPLKSYTSLPMLNSSDLYIELWNLTEPEILSFTTKRRQISESQTYT